MPDTPPTTMIHFRNEHRPLRAAVCGELFGIKTSEPGKVTCFACRKDPQFIRARDTPPVRLAGIIEQHPVMAAMYEQAIARGEPVPQYLHDCSDCEYLGSTLRRTGDETIQRVELYWCHAPEEGNVLARMSDGLGDYVSGLSAAQHDPDLALAVVRAIHKGLFRANALHFL
jgi:hypothetical protein